MLSAVNAPSCGRQLCLALLICVLPARAELFLASFSGNRVLRYSETNGTFISVFVASGSGGLNLPHGLAFGPDGNFYVASAGTDEVLRYIPDRELEDTPSCRRRRKEADGLRGRVLRLLTSAPTDRLEPQRSVRH